MTNNILQIDNLKFIQDNLHSSNKIICTRYSDLTGKEETIIITSNFDKVFKYLCDKALFLNYIQVSLYSDSDLIGRYICDDKYWDKLRLLLQDCPLLEL